MKKGIALFLTALMTLSAVGCASSSPAPATSPAAPAASSDTPSAAAPADDFQYPTSTVTIVVPYSAGGAMDTTARLFAKHAQEITGQTFVISNVAGGSGSVGAADVLSSKADGNKVLIFDPGPGFVNTESNPVPFDVEKDFVYVGRQTSDIRNVVVRADDERFKTSEEFVEYVKNHPGEINISCAGTSTDASLTVELLKRAGLDMTMVPFSGAADAKASLLGKHVDATSLSIGDSISLLNDSQIRVIAVCSEERSPILPDAPTFTELGYDIVWSTSRGYAFKAGTDPRIVDAFESILKQVCENPGYEADITATGCPVDFMGAERLRRLLFRKICHHP